MIHLEDAGRFERAVLTVQGRTELDAHLWVREGGPGSTWESCGLEYLPMTGAIQVRRRPGRPRYLLVDGDRRVVAEIDLRLPPRESEAVTSPIEDPRAEFGEDLTGVSADPRTGPAEPK